MALAMCKEVVWKKVRDLAATLAVLGVLFGMLMAINPRVRERFGEMTASVQGRDMNSSIGPVGNAAYAAMSIGSDYAADNPFLFCVSRRGRRAVHADAEKLMMSTVLVVQPDEVQADVLRQIFAKRVGAELVMVDSTMEAVDEIARRMPDLILLSALLSPRDEDTLIAHLRSLDGASHLQTITIPQFRTGPAKAPEKKGGLFRKKSKAPAPIGCDPMAFAEEVVAHLKDACEIRNRPQAPRPAMNVIASSAPPPLIEDDVRSHRHRRSIPRPSNRSTSRPSRSPSCRSR